MGEGHDQRCYWIQLDDFFENVDDGIFDSFARNVNRIDWLNESGKETLPRANGGKSHRIRWYFRG